MLVTLKELLQQYMTSDKAVGAFNVASSFFPTFRWRWGG